MAVKIFTQIGAGGRDWGIRLRGKPAFQNFLNELNRFCGSQSTFLGKLGETAVDMIQKRTISGIDVNGNLFPPYDADYARKKGTARRNLSSTGNPKQGMLGAVSYKVGIFKVVIYVVRDMLTSGYYAPNNQYIKAEVHNYGMISGRRNSRFLMPRSEWFGLMRSQVEKLYHMTHENFMAFIQKFKSGGLFR